ncbi:MAG: exopolysaccharide biosynthesis polyprenyl glycosylphosphotransferase [Amaricoccus sp.]|uniref:exopolysaccharide biosynthesis polyprenyl glycosylphosphotransferase n=1 Tax=Amaricoccus sp. TaxID=1872485 RepID=UPI0039E59427
MNQAVNIDIPREGELSAGARSVARGLRRGTLAPGTLSALAGCIDAAALALALWFAAYAGDRPEFAPVAASLLAVTAALAAVGLIGAFGGYRLSALRNRPRGIVLVAACGIALLLAGGVPLWPGVSFVGFFVLPARLLGAALAAAALDYGLTERRAVIIGGGQEGARLLAALAATPDNDIQICGIFDDRDDERSPAVIDGVPKLGRTDTLVDFVRATEIDLLLITLPLSAERRIRSILKAVEVLPVDVRLVGFSADAGLRRHGAAGPIDVMARPLRASERALKRTLDFVGASVALVLLSPVLLATAAAIRYDSPGPIFFRQPRHGYNHRPVEVLKFRSMYTGDCDPAARRVVTKGDPRVTRVGRFIRRWSIDELPQLFNVLTGELSLVGPRPHPVTAVSSRQEAFEAIVEGYAARHKMRPGVTGWAQINGLRGEIDDPAALRARVEHDLCYIENWSIWLDLRILALTPFRLVDSRNAY